MNIDNIERRKTELDSLQLAKEIADLAVGKLAEDVLLLDVRGITLVADYFLICSGGTERQVQAIAEEIQQRLNEKDVKPYGVEGSETSGWILLDYSDVIVHIFLPKTRRYYDLESLWKRAKTVLRIA